MVTRLRLRSVCSVLYLTLFALVGITSPAHITWTPVATTRGVYYILLTAGNGQTDETRPSSCDSIRVIQPN